MTAQLISITPTKVNLISPEGQLFVFPGNHRAAFHLDRTHGGFGATFQTFQGIRAWVESFNEREPLRKLEHYADEFLKAISRNECGLGDLFPRDRALSLLEHAITLPWLDKGISFFGDAIGEEDDPLEWEDHYNFETLLDLVELVNQIPYEPAKLQDTYLAPPFEEMIDSINFNEDMFQDLHLSDRVLRLLQENAVSFLNAAVVQFETIFHMSFAGFGSEETEAKFQHLNYGGRLGYLNLFEVKELQPDESVVETTYNGRFQQLEQVATNLLQSTALSGVPTIQVLKILAQTSEIFGEPWEPSYQEIISVEISKNEVRQEVHRELSTMN
jgi:hypothetical protein